MFRKNLMRIYERKILRNKLMDRIGLNISIFRGFIKGFMQKIFNDGVAVIPKFKPKVHVRGLY